ncbi:unnamed protein product [Boreogadus saida]
MADLESVPVHQAAGSGPEQQVQDQTSRFRTIAPGSRSRTRAAGSSTSQHRDLDFLDSHSLTSLQFHQASVQINFKVVSVQPDPDIAKRDDFRDGHGEGAAVHRQGSRTSRLPPIWRHQGLDLWSLQSSMTMVTQATARKLSIKWPPGGNAILLELLICTEEGFALCLNPAADYGTRKCCVMLTTDMFVDLS